MTPSDMLEVPFVGRRVGGSREVCQMYPKINCDSRMAYIYSLSITNSPVFPDPSSPNLLWSSQAQLFDRVEMDQDTATGRKR